MKVVFSVFFMLSSVVGVGSVKAGTSGVDSRFVRITGAGVTESHAHDVTITRESPNYHRN